MQKVFLYIFLIASFCVSFSVQAFQDDSLLVSQLKGEIKQNEGLKRAVLLDSLGTIYSHQNKADLAFSYKQKALTAYKTLAEKEKAAECNYEIYKILVAQQESDVDALPYLKAFEKYAVAEDDQEKLLSVKFNYASYFFNSGDKNQVRTYYQDALKIARSLNDSNKVSSIYANLGLLHSGRFQNQDSARYYFGKSLSHFKQQKDTLKVVISYINYANSFQKEKKHQQAINYLDSIQPYKIKKHKLGFDSIIFQKYIDLYKALGNYQKALLYQEKLNLVEDSLNTTKQNIAISDIKTKYETEKKEKENLILKNDLRKKKQTQLILWIVIIATLIIATIIGFLIKKNARKKEQLIKQQQQLKLQQVEKQLKQHELNTIDMMIAGQEKERQRMAEELHDNLGSSLAAIRMNIENLKHEENQPETVQKIMALINDSYQKVRGMAHEKQSGVLAKSGLLPAIKRFANNVSSPNGLQVQVEDFGLNQKLENSLEITIFRIIQELITNIIKHAEATEASISLTSHDHVLNIIVDDNGKGFSDTDKKRPKTEGIGLETIERRIEHMGGSFTIDSNPNRGTSIILNIPI